MRAVIAGFNPQGVHVARFKVPGKGEFVTLGRSRHEDILVMPVHRRVPEDLWRKRSTEIHTVG